MQRLWKVFKRTISDFSDDDCMTSGAAMAYYAIFSMPPLMVIVFSVASYLGVSRERIDRIVENQVGLPAAAVAADRQAANDSPAAAEESDAATSSGALGWATRIVGVVLLLFAATGLFAQLQHALNRAWDVEPDSKHGGILRLALKRIASLGMIVVIAFLLVTSLALTTILDDISATVFGGAPKGLAIGLGIALDNLTTFVIATLLFAAMFKVLPDAQITWKDVWVGAASTAILFVIGKTMVGLYLDNFDVGSGWGAAAASTVGALVWVYYSSLIVLFGAELTETWATEHGRRIEPAPGAVRKGAAKQS
jgi:membrane protein